MISVGSLAVSLFHFAVLGSYPQRGVFIFKVRQRVRAALKIIVVNQRGRICPHPTVRGFRYLAFYFPLQGTKDMADCSVLSST